MNLQDNINKFMNVINNKDSKYIVICGDVRGFDFGVSLTDIDINIINDKLNIKGNKLELNIYLHDIERSSFEYKKHDSLELYDLKIKINDGLILLSYSK